MKGITKIALSIALVAILTLSVVVASVAWFTSNPSVDAGDVTLEAARTLNIVFDSENGETDYMYNGELGNDAVGTAGEPYVYEAGGFNVVLRTSANGKTGRVRMTFGSVEIDYHPGVIRDVLITDLFTLSANCYVRDDAGGYVKDHNVFVAYDAEKHSELDRYDLLQGYTINDDGYLMDGNEEAEFEDGAYAFAFVCTFIPTASYADWLAGRYSSVAGYELSAGGDYIGVVSYEAYKAKIHDGMTRYSLANGIYTEDEEGSFVKVVSSYVPYANVQKYTEVEENVFSATSDGNYLKIAGTDEFILFNRYNKINGFPYSHPRYMDAVYKFSVVCSLEEV